MRAVETPAAYAPARVRVRVRDRSRARVRVRVRVRGRPAVRVRVRVSHLFPRDVGVEAGHARLARGGGRARARG